MDADVGRSNVVRVATFNIRAGSASGTFIRPRLWPTVVAARSLCADVLALQEVDRRAPRSLWRDQSTVMGRALGMTSGFALARRLPGGGHYGVAMLSTTPLRAVETFSLPEEFGTERRVALIGSVVGPAGPMTVCSTHLQNVRPSEGGPTGRGMAARQLAALLAHVAERPGPRIVMGDLNMGPKEVEPIARAHGFDALTSGPTFPANDPKVQLDWVLTDGASLVDVEVPDERASDHRPVVARLMVEAGSDVSSAAFGRVPHT